MIIVEDILVEHDVVRTHFACDVTACKGACCTIPGGRGAPVREDELVHLDRAAAELGPELSPRHQAILKSHGPYEGPAGDRTTVCVDNGACVFVADHAGIAICSIERAHFQGRFPWRKPLSCHLFPIRIDRGPQDRLRYEVIDACASAVARGADEGIPLISFTRDALERAYGRPWVDALEHAAETDHSTP